MAKTTPGCIRLRGVRQNNLKNIDLDVPLGQLVVISGLSGSGKSSLAFETLFAEGQRRYIETFSPYARQFLDRMDKPQARRIEGIPPAIAIEQRNSVKSSRSTVGTMTEITDYAKLFWGHLARLHCRSCGQPVTRQSPPDVWQTMRARAPEADAMVTFSVELSAKFSMEESLALLARQGFHRLLLDGRPVALDQSLARLQAAPPARLTVIQDRVKLNEANRGRFTGACEQAYHFGKGKLAVHLLKPEGGEVSQSFPFSRALHCAVCDLDYAEPSAALFSFNHPFGACPKCRGFGRVIAIDYDAAIPDRSKTLAGGAVKPWQTKTGLECQMDMQKFAKPRDVPMDVPFRDLPKKFQDWVIEGDPGYGADKAHEWPRAWYGVKGYFRWLESKAYKMHVRVLLARYRRYETCPDCHGARLQPDALLYTMPAPGDGRPLALPDFYRMTARQALAFVDLLIDQRSRAKASDPVVLALEETRSRLGFLDESGLGYLALDRMTRSLSGGETGRVNLAACLGSRLVNTLFVLDEPSVGLHPRDTARLVRVVRRLREAGNTVVLVEHEAAVMRAADQIIDLGPGHGATGGKVVFQGTYQEILRSPRSLTGQYLSGKKKIETPRRRPVIAEGRAGRQPGHLGSSTLKIRHATLHNLKNVTVEIPLQRLVCVTGVSGSGKSTLVREILLPALKDRLASTPTAPAANSDPNFDQNPAPDPADSSDTDLPDAPTSTATILEGWESLTRVVAVDQSLLGRTPRSNPAVYVGAFDDIRALFAQTPGAARRGLGASAFSFNSAQGQCERCRGAGFEKIEMQFLSDIFVRCPDCDGRRYRSHILAVKAVPPASPDSPGLNIAQLLEATVDDAIIFLRGFGAARPALRAAASLRLLQEVGLGYVRLGQPINTLSGGESQRLKLVSHLAEEERRIAGDATKSNHPAINQTLFVFDEPTTGLHFEDVRVLLKVFQRLVGAGHSVLVIEHNLDVIKCADWVIDLGPEGGTEGGKVVVVGTPEEVAATPASHTGQALAGVLAVNNN